MIFTSSDCETSFEQGVATPCAFRLVILRPVPLVYTMGGNGARNDIMVPFIF
jgi:hypothetical protein